MFTWLAACSSSFPSPITTYVMLVPKRETIRSKQLSLPGDKQTGFHRIRLDASEAQRATHAHVSVHAANDGKKTHTTLTYYSFFNLSSHSKSRFLCFSEWRQVKVIVFSHDSALTPKLVFLKQEAVLAFL